MSKRHARLTHSSSSAALAAAACSKQQQRRRQQEVWGGRVAGAAHRRLCVALGDEADGALGGGLGCPGVQLDFGFNIMAFSAVLCEHCEGAGLVLYRFLQI